MTSDNEPFGRQPKPVTVTLSGEPIDVETWLRNLMRRAESAGDQVQRLSGSSFIIYPRAVND